MFGESASEEDSLEIKIYSVDEDILKKLEDRLRSEKVEYELEIVM